MTELRTAKSRLSDRRKRAADLVVDAVLQAGARCIFGIPGAAISPIFDALCDAPQLRLIVPKHEMSAVYGAIGYARATQGLGVAAVTSGPGILNAVSAIASAQLDGVPVLVLVGEVARSVRGRGALQEGGSHGLGIVNLLRPLTKLAIEVPEPGALLFTIRHAIDAAISGRRGPVVLTLPLDVALADVEVPYVSQRTSTSFELDGRALDAAAKAMTRSNNSVLFVGSGCRWGNGPDLVRQLAERLDLPVMTTPKGKGIFPEDHPLSVGVFGLAGHPSATELMSTGVEVLVALGTRMGELSSLGWSKLLKPTRTLIHVDVEAAHVGRSYATHMSFTAPVELFARALLDHIGPREAKAGRTLGVRHHENAWTARGAQGLVAPARATVELARAAGPRARFAVDSGEHTLYAIHYLPANAHDMVLLQLGLGSMGASIGAALGLYAADPDRPVVVVCGDGGFLMCAAEVATAAHAGFGVVFAVFNDRRLGMTELGHQAFFGRTPSFATGPVELTALARGLGAEGHTVTSPDQFASLDLRRPRKVPLVLDIRIDTGCAFARNVETKRGWLKAEAIT